MNIKLHNKFEVLCGDESYVAYNTMLCTVFEKIKNLEPYNSYFAFGTGTGAVNVSADKLGSYVASFENETEQIQPDCKKGEMFVVKSKIFAENEQNGLTFSEIGLTDSAEADPIIFNHVVFTDEEGEVFSVTKRAGKEMVVKLTIYLEVLATSNAKLIAGQNPLVKQLLGEDVLLNRALVFAKGNNNQPNVEIYREPPRDIEPVNFERLDYYQAQGGGIGIKFDCDYGQNVVREIVVLADGIPVIRYNCLAIKSPLNVTQTLTKSTNNCIDLGDDVKLVVSCKSVSGTQDIRYVLNSYAHCFGDYVACPFDMPFNAQTQRFVAKDGSMIAFVLNNSIYVYKNDNLLITKLDASTVSAQNVQDVLMINGFVFLKLSESPYLKAFKDDGGVLKELSIVNAQNYPLDLENVDITQSKDNKIRIAGISAQTTGVCYLANILGENLTIETKLETTATGFLRALCLYKNNYCDSLVYFLATSANGTGFPLVVMVDENGVMSNSSLSALPTLLTTNVINAFGTDRLLICKKQSVNGSAILNTYFFPEGLRYNVPNDGEIDMWCSPDFKYIIKKYSDTEYNIYSIIGLNTPVEFDDGLFGSLTQSEFVDFVFLKDTLLIFTSNAQKPIIAINLNLTSGMLEGLTDLSPSEVVVDFQKYRPLGAISGEYVEAKLTFTVGGVEA